MPRYIIVLLITGVIGAMPLVALANGFSQVARLAERGFVIGAQAKLLDSGEIVGELNPNRLLTPASVSKLYISAAALDRWGPQHRFSTRLLSLGDIDTRGVLHGDLVLEGGGDPALASEDLWRLIQRLRQRGVTRIDGQLVVSQWRFGPVDCLTADRCRALTRSDNAYSALLSSAAINYGSWCINVLPGSRIGGVAEILSCDTVEPTTHIENRVTTVAPGGRTALSAERTTNAEGDALSLGGQIAIDAQPQAIYRASSDPAAQTAKTLQYMLQRAGISIRDGVAVSNTPPPIEARQLAAVDGQPLQELLLRMLNYSNNFMADILGLNLVETPRSTLLQASGEIERFAQGLYGHGPLNLLSGSGLTTQNRTSASGVIALLESMYQRSELFPAFVSGLQLPINGPMHFIQRGSHTFQSRVMLKTGTLNQPIAVRALGGYFRTMDGRWGAFSVLVNGTYGTPYLNWSEVLDPVSRDLTAMIEAH